VAYFAALIEPLVVQAEQLEDERKRRLRRKPEQQVDDERLRRRLRRRHNEAPADTQIAAVYDDPHAYKYLNLQRWTEVRQWCTLVHF
jgi:hypothetical protein